jgi:hypothetical protein
LEKCVAKWSAADQPLFLRFRDHVVLASREDAWYLLASAITGDLLEEFEEFAALVLGEENPALAMEANSRWMAGLHGKVHALSSDLRDGLVVSLALMSCYPTAQQSGSRLDFAESARRIIDRSLPSGASWKLWASLDRHLPILAEANPDLVLTKLEDDLRSATPQVPLLFDHGGAGIHASPLHCGLLWALETMAWNPQLIGRVADVLARLSDYEDRMPANMANRPSNSLAAIFLWWLPYTNASIDERIAVLRRLLHDRPRAGWRLVVGLLPTGRSSTSSPITLPRWRTWAAGWSREKVRQEMPLYAVGQAELVVEFADLDAGGWSEVLDGIFRFSDGVTERAIQKLRAVASQCTDEQGRRALWGSLRDLLGLHEQYPD